MYNDDTSDAQEFDYSELMQSKIRYVVYHQTAGPADLQDNIHFLFKNFTILRM